MRILKPIVNRFLNEFFNKEKERKRRLTTDLTDRRDREGGPVSSPSIRKCK
jgi:hypothetical protein